MCATQLRVVRPRVVRPGGAKTGGASCKEVFKSLLFTWEELAAG